MNSDVELLINRIHEIHIGLYMQNDLSDKLNKLSRTERTRPLNVEAEYIRDILLRYLTLDLAKFYEKKDRNFPNISLITIMDSDQGVKKIDVDGVTFEFALSEVIKSEHCKKIITLRDKSICHSEKWNSASLGGVYYKEIIVLYKKTRNLVNSLAIHYNEDMSDDRIKYDGSLVRRIFTIL